MLNPDMPNPDAGDATLTRLTLQSLDRARASVRELLALYAAERRHITERRKLLARDFELDPGRK